MAYGAKMMALVCNTTVSPPTKANLLTNAPSINAANNASAQDKASSATDVTELASAISTTARSAPPAEAAKCFNSAANNAPDYSLDDWKQHFADKDSKPAALSAEALKESITEYSR